MIRLFKHYVPHTVLLLGLIDFAMLMLAAEGGWMLRGWQIAGKLDPEAARLPLMTTFALVLQLAMIGVGVYGVEALQSLRFAVPRLFVAITFGVLLLALNFFLVPSGPFGRTNLRYAPVLALVGLGGVRLMLGRSLGADLFKRRVVVLGAGPRSARRSSRYRMRRRSPSRRGGRALRGGLPGGRRRARRRAA